MLTEIITDILSVLTIIGDIFIILVLICGVFSSNDKVKQLKEKAFSVFDKRLILSTFIVALIATLGSLFYSNIAGYDPCKLCWFQRIFMYPQVIMLWVAYRKSDKQIWTYSIPLSVIGFFIAVYHYIIQFSKSPLVPCSTVGYSVSCSDHFALNYGYITIPMMAVTAFALMIVFMLRQRETIDKTKKLS